MCVRDATELVCTYGSSSFIVKTITKVSEWIIDSWGWISVYPGQGLGGASVKYIGPNTVRRKIIACADIVCTIILVVPLQPQYVFVITTLSPIFKKQSRLDFGT